MKDVIQKFLKDQLSVWPEAAASFRSLKSAEKRSFKIGGLDVVVQHNPGRIRSSAADTTAGAISGRPCFLCRDNRPAVQRSLPFEGRKGRKYDILVNPYPIFPVHLTIARDVHCEQSIWKCLPDMSDLARKYPALTVFYNGPQCGASAPDHMHFQACRRGLMPLEKTADKLLDGVATRLKGVPYGEEQALVPEELSSEMDYLSSVQEAQLYHYKKYARGVFFLRARTSKSLAKLFYRLLDAAPVPDGGKEPMFNMLMWYKQSSAMEPVEDASTHGMAGWEYRAVVIFRSRHRSHHYFSKGDDHLTMSPGCADMAGLFIAPQEWDFRKLNAVLLNEMLTEVSLSAQVEEDILWRLTRKQELLRVGIMSADKIVFEIISDGAGPQSVSCREGKLDYNGALYDGLCFEGRTLSTIFAEPTFILHDVTIGVDFHWQRNMELKYAGTLHFIPGNGKVIAVDEIGLEDYLLSVISSEMNPDSPLEFLKAHAVISRSWVMSRMPGHRDLKGHVAGCPDNPRDLPGIVTKFAGTDEGMLLHEDDGDTVRLVRWFDHEDHKYFDVCADDHCQRYQGLGTTVSDKVRQAIDSTWGMVLMSDGKLCDARFSKCCGGRSELFSTCWQDTDMPYLQSLPDSPGHDPHKESFCTSADYKILSKVLKDYDLSDPDFLDWEVRYTVDELSSLVSRKSGTDIGRIVSITPLRRGPSGRISSLEIRGDRRRLILGKELMIRRTLSESHLKSSCFDVVFEDGKIVLKGRGWGHGVGLCQIGAAQMAERGYDFRAILDHYYPGAEICRM